MSSVFENYSLVKEMDVDSNVDNKYSSDLCDSSSDESEQIQTPSSEIEQNVLFLCDSLLCDGSVSSSESVNNQVDDLRATQDNTSTVTVNDVSTTSLQVHIGSYPESFDYKSLEKVSLCSSATMEPTEHNEFVPLHVYPCLYFHDPNTLDDPTLDLFDLYQKPTIRPVLARAERDNDPLPFEDCPPPSPKRVPVALSVRNIVRSGPRTVAREPKAMSQRENQHPYPIIATRPKPTRGTIHPRFNTLARCYNDNFAVGHHILPVFLRKYTLEAEIGTGGYGFVMAARDRELGHEVAVKFMLKTKVPRHGWYEIEPGRMVPKEIYFLSITKHENIVKLIDYYEDDLYFYIVQELHGDPWPSRKNRRVQHVIEDAEVSVSSMRPEFPRRPSHDLFECLEQLKHKRFSEADARHIFIQIVDAIEYLDRLGITHCDMKDENIVIDKNMKVKLIDFGSAIYSDPSKERPLQRKFFGTIEYASPEIMMKMPYRVQKAEIWALGILLSFLITGSSPFASEQDRLRGTVRLDTSRGSGISSGCLHLIRQCLRAQPRRRPTIRQVKKHPWLVDPLVEVAGQN